MLCPALAYSSVPMLPNYPLMLRRAHDSRLAYSDWYPCRTPGCARKVSPEEKDKGFHECCCFCGKQPGHAGYCAPPRDELTEQIVFPAYDEPDPPVWLGNHSPRCLPPPPIPQPKARPKNMPRGSSEEENLEQPDAAAHAAAHEATPPWRQQKEDAAEDGAASIMEQRASWKKKEDAAAHEATPPWRQQDGAAAHKAEAPTQQKMVWVNQQLKKFHEEAGEAEEVPSKKQKTGSAQASSSATPSHPWSRQACPWTKKRVHPASVVQELTALRDYFERVEQQDQQYLDALVSLHHHMSEDLDALESALDVLGRA